MVVSCQTEGDGFLFASNNRDIPLPLLYFICDNGFFFWKEKEKKSEHTSDTHPFARTVPRSIQNK